MQRSLVLGCAVAALTIGSGSAFAQSKFDVTIGGDVLFQGAYVDQDADPAGSRSTEIRNRYRLVVTPTAKADNGLEYGGRLRLRAGSAGAGNVVDYDRAFMFASSGFGTVQAGVINGLSDEFGIIGPNIEGIAGGADNLTLDFAAAASPLPSVFVNAENFRNFVAGDNGTKLIYLSPKIAGFQGGVSYMPRASNFGMSIDRAALAAPADRTSVFEDVVEVGGIYSREIGAVTLDASAFYQFGTAPGADDLSSYHVGANIGFGDIKVGGMYMNAGDSGYAAGLGGADIQTWQVGANYTLGPVILAANYLNYRDAGSLLTAGNARMDLYQTGVTYTIAPGLTTGLEYSYFRAREDGARDKGSIIMLDTRLAF